MAISNKPLTQAQLRKLRLLARSRVGAGLELNQSIKGYYGDIDRFIKMRGAGKVGRELVNKLNLQTPLRRIRGNVDNIGYYLTPKERANIGMVSGTRINPDLLYSIPKSKAVGGQYQYIRGVQEGTLYGRGRRNIQGEIWGSLTNRPYTPFGSYAEKGRERVRELRELQQANPTAYNKQVEIAINRGLRQLEDKYIGITLEKKKKELTDRFSRSNNSPLVVFRASYGVKSYKGFAENQAQFSRDILWNPDYYEKWAKFVETQIIDGVPTLLYIPTGETNTDPELVARFNIF